MSLEHNVLIQNIYTMIAYTFKTLNHTNYKHINHESFDYIDDLFAELLIVGMNTQIKKGIAKGYQPYSEPLRVLRGKMNISTSIGQMTLIDKRIQCDFDEFVENILINQIIKTLLMRLMCSNQVNKTRKKRIRRLLTFFSQVDDVDLKRIRFEDIQLSRHHRSYRLMIYLAYLYQKQSIFSNSDGSMNLMQFADGQQMALLYEFFVRAYFEIHHPGLNPRRSIMKWTDDDLSIIPVMKTDVILSGRDTNLIIDTKYYGSMMQTSEYGNRIRTGHIYQIYAYVANHALKSQQPVQGMLLYALTRNESPLDATTMMGGYKIHFKSLDLNQPFSLIRKQLDDIASLLI